MSRAFFKTLQPVLILLSLPGLAFAAKTVVVSDQLPINVRSGVGTGHGIIGAAHSGERLEVLGEEPGYYKVRTPRGKEGWVLARFVQDEPVARDQLEALQTQRDSAVQAREQAEQGLEALRSEHAALLEAHEQLLSEAQTLRQQLNEVSTAAASTLEIQQRNTELEQALGDAQVQGEALRDDLNSRELRRSNMLLGAGILLAGLLIGLIIPLLRPRRTSSW